MIKEILFLWFLALAIGTSACDVTAQNSNNHVSQENNEEYIWGTWRLDGELPPNNTGHGFHWFLEYTFSSDGKFLLTGYPPLMQKGKYRIVKSEDNKLTLDLYEQSGNFGTKDKEIEIVVDIEKETLKIDGKEGFKPVKKKARNG
jgi:hypothetical protein